MPTNAIDLSTIAKVKFWLGVTSSGDDQNIQDTITAFSQYVLRLTGRGPIDGSVPTVSPFTSVCPYDDVLDGNGNNILPLRNWPIATVTSVNSQGVAIAASSGITGPGYVIDATKKFLLLRGGGSVGGYRGRAMGPRFAGACWPLGTQNIEVVYTAGFATLPADLEMAARKVVALNYQRRKNIGQKSQAMAQGAGTISFDEWEMPPDAERTILYYARRVA